MILFLIFKDALAAAGRARIEQQKQTALANIQKNKEAALTALNIQYAAADKAKTSFGYIGITFLVVLFGSIFLNDFIQRCIYLYNECFKYLLEKRRDNQENEKENEKDNDRTVLDMDENLEEKLERVYFKLIQSNVSN